MKDLVKRNKIKLKYIESEKNIADGFTKYLIILSWIDLEIVY